MPPGGSGLFVVREDGFEDEGDMTYAKRVCGFQAPVGVTPQYKAWREAVKGRLQEFGITGERNATKAQWAEVLGYAVRLKPVSTKVRLWGRKSAEGQRFSACVKFLVADCGKKLRVRLQGLPDVGAVGPAPMAGNQPVADIPGQFKKHENPPTISKQDTDHINRRKPG